MKIILITFIFIFTSSVNAAECIGHVFFYNLEEGKGEADYDFAYYYNKSREWLAGEGVHSSVHTELPIEFDTCFSNKVTVPKDQLEFSLGYVFVKPNLERKVVGGVMTDIDISTVVNDFFK